MDRGAGGGLGLLRADSPLKPRRSLLDPRPDLGLPEQREQHVDTDMQRVGVRHRDAGAADGTRASVSYWGDQSASLGDEAVYSGAFHVSGQLCQSLSSELNSTKSDH